MTRAEQCVGVFEAEEALLSGAVVARTHAGATNGNYVDFQHVDEDFVEWTIPNCAAGRSAGRSCGLRCVKATGQLP